MNNYELLFFVSTTLDEEKFTTIIDRIKGIITSGTGEVESVDDWGARRLAYTVNRMDDGHYVLINFKSVPALIASLAKQLRYVQDVVRFVVVRKGD